MVPLRRQRRRLGHPGKPTSQILAPNDLWSADYKGQFRTGDGRYCYPLTVTDGFSRYLLGCQALTSTAGDEAKPIFTRLFREYGLPTRIRTDNGVPFATTTLARLSKLSAWWVRLGILPELIEPGRPQQNGRHERMHRTLKAETTREVFTQEWDPQVGTMVCTEKGGPRWPSNRESHRIGGRFGSAWPCSRT
jgi:transposase InsO family protein